METKAILLSFAEYFPSGIFMQGNANTCFELARSLQVLGKILERSYKIFARSCEDLARILQGSYKIL